VSKPEEDTHLISQRAELFRTKLIHAFHLVEMFGERGIDSGDQPYMYPKDIVDEGLCRNMMMTEPHGLIQFKVYSEKAYFCSINSYKQTVPKLKQAQWQSRISSRPNVWTRNAVLSTGVPVWPKIKTHVLPVAGENKIETEGRWFIYCC